ncbi:MAG: hypothetical protein JWQ49_973 [Edaphobacter sp.]|nr:hypothetical protein [Edaphobacter sp.]
MGRAMNIDAAILRYSSSSLRLSDGSLDSELAFATRVMRESRQTGRLPSGLPFYLRSACRAQHTPALRGHALLPRIRCAPLKRCGLLPQSKFGSPSADSIQSPREWVATPHQLGKHVPQTADKPKETELNTMFNKSSSSAASDRTQKPKPLRTTKSTSSSTSPPRKAGRTTRANRKPAPNGIASSPGAISRSSPRPFRRGS